MPNDDAYWFMVNFKLKLYESSGDQFQTLFNSVMMAHYGIEY
jgi:hypothetical protein